MNFSQFLLILYGRRKLVLLVLFVTIATAFVASLLQHKSYKSTATLVLNYKGTDPVSGITLPSQLMPGYMATQVDIIDSMSTALKVVDELKLVDDAKVKQDYLDATDGKGSIREWRAAHLLKHLEVVPMRESSVLNISFSGSTPKFAADVANAFASAYQNTSVQLTVEPSRKASIYFNGQIKQLREKVDAAQKKLSDYQQENGIVGVDNRLDVETARLNELSTQLAVAQGQALEAASRGSQARGEHAAESPDVAANPLVQSLKTQLAQAELQLTNIAQRFTEEHPFYQKAQAAVDKLRGELNEQIRSSSNSIANNARILQKRDADLHAALEDQKVKVLSLSRKHDEIKALNNEVERAQRNYEAAAQRFTQTSLEGQSNLTDVAVLNPAAPAITAEAPRLLLNTLLAVFLGILLGVGFAILAEMLDRRVRSAADLARGLQAPVLGVMTWRESKPRRVMTPPLLPYQPLSH